MEVQEDDMEVQEEAVNIHAWVIFKALNGPSCDECFFLHLRVFLSAFS